VRVTRPVVVEHEGGVGSGRIRDGEVVEGVPWPSSTMERGQRVADGRSQRGLVIDKRG
jgi:hypothetical protein